MILLQAFLWFVFIIGLVVFIHELGHFVSAKLVGITVEEFAFGFGKAVLKKNFKGTLYRINFLPIGGYVKLLGEEEDIDEPGSFRNKSLIARAFVICAGVIMNLILAIIVFYGILIIKDYEIYLPVASDFSFVGNVAQRQKKPVVSDVIEDTPAAKAKFPSDVVLWKINQDDIKDIQSFLEVLKENKGKKVTIEYLSISDGSSGKKDVVLEEEPDEILLGVKFDSRYAPFYKLDYSSLKVYSGALHAINFGAYNLDAFGELIRQSFEDKSVKPVSEGVVGVVGVADVVLSIVKVGDVLNLFELLASINLMLAIANLLPIPGLDGGHLVFILLETITGKQIAEKYRDWAIRIGFVLLMLLGALITIKDIVQFNVVSRTWEWLENLF